jgi:hypothetical protein
MLKTVFHGPEWIITPEKTDENSKKRPDLVVEKFEDGKAEHYLFMELKASNGDRFEDAISQVVDEIAETMEEGIEAYVVVQRGLKIGFFEYHNDVSNLDEEDIPHFKGCISLTQNYPIDGKVTKVLSEPLPAGVDLLFHNYTKLRKVTDNREAAEEYKTSCIFDICKHQKVINLLFDHMVNKKPRSSVWVRYCLERFQMFNCSGFEHSTYSILSNLYVI